MLATATSHNQTAKVTKADVLGLLSRYPLPPPDEREIAYNKAVELLVNTQLLNQFLAAQHVEVPEVEDRRTGRARQAAAQAGGPGPAHAAAPE